MQLQGHVITRVQVCVVVCVCVCSCVPLCQCGCPVGAVCVSVCVCVRAHARAEKIHITIGPMPQFCGPQSPTDTDDNAVETEYDINGGQVGQHRHMH